MLTRKKQDLEANTKSFFPFFSFQDSPSFPIIFVFTPQFSSQASLILRQIIYWFLPLSLSQFVSFFPLFFSSNLCLIVYDVSLCCFHVYVLPSRVVEVYCVSVSLRRF